MSETLKTDILVAGGGLAGVCAAIAAARNGASVILVQDRSRLGGNSSSEIRMHVCGANHTAELLRWRETGIIEELRLTNAATNPQHSFEVWDLILYDKVISEKNIRLMLDTAVTDATVEGNRLVSVKACSPLLEENYTIEAEYFIDCTGDGTLGARAGAEFMRGREGRDTYGESLAPVKSDQKTMGNSILFTSRKHNQPMPFVAPEWIRHFTEKDFQHRPIHRWEFGYWWIEWGGELDTIRDNRKIRHELLRIALGVWNYIKNSRNFPEAENWALEWLGMIPGKRESRRFTGEHVMIQSEMENTVEYPDRVTYGGWPMDDHPPGGIDRNDLKPCEQIRFRQPYHIPLRSLYSRNRVNLLMAGRNISASHVAFSSTRVMATCAVIGQAAGSAAAFCVQSGMQPRELVQNAAELTWFQQRLLKDDQAILGVKNTDPNDLARQATITASGEIESGPAGSVLDGVNRDIGDGLSHQWQAEMTNPAPWLDLTWNKPQSVRKLQLTFDSGLNRLLFMTGEVQYYQRQIFAPQPEIVVDYEIKAEVDGKLKSLVSVQGNYLRFVRHEIKPIKTRRIRIILKQTQGDELVRLFEVRCYA